MLNALSVAVVLITAMYLWMNGPFNFILEETFMKGTLLVDKIFVDKSDLPYQIDDVLFIDVAQSKSIVRDSTGTHVMADRARLDTLFQLIHQHGNANQIIVCDLYFDYPSPQDSALQVSMGKVNNLLSEVKTNREQDITPNVIRAGTSGTSGFTNLKEPFLIFSNSLLKFRLTDKNCVKTLPLLIYEKIHHESISCERNALHIGNDWFFNTILIKEQLALKANNVFMDEVRPIQRLLNAVKANQPEYIAELRDKKFIVIGDFREDVHKTTLGDKPGPLIIFDVFLSLQKKENKIGTLWLALSVVFLTVHIYKKFYHVNLFIRYNRWLNQQIKFLGFKRPIKFNWLLFYLYVLGSAILFKVYLEVVAGILFFIALAWLRIYVKTRIFKWKRLQDSGARLNLPVLISFIFKKPGFKN